jgi:hypothetical protein
VACSPPGEKYGIRLSKYINRIPYDIKRGMGGKVEVTAGCEIQYTGCQKYVPIQDYSEGAPLFFRWTYH